ncbi:spore germination protein GerPC [Paenibacillus sp. L3-i20]|uniref:spore germination protein GerPC n=1 Tax=Paenibacillus sp. L3-i20 TaxID=2905833 RepID=UPI001EDD30B3|nr:spore germination protein GerPC [Paenibacillus sp. L3-i20]GKU79683.1 germination protein PC [Paenibacillus sp. L3-i20]
MKEQNQLSPWQVWSNAVEQRLKNNKLQIEQLECTVADLCAQLKKLEAKPTYNIESIEYHFDQLKVEKLDGTLNIGMTAPGMGGNGGNGVEPFSSNIEQLSVNNQNQYPSASPAITPPEGPYNDIFRKLNHFLDNDAPHLLMQHEDALTLPLDPYHRKIIIEDVRKQMPTRIHYYLQRMKKEDKEALDAYPNLLIDDVYGKTKQDAETAISAYMRQLKEGNALPGGL